MLAFFEVFTKIKTIYKVHKFPHNIHAVYSFNIFAFYSPDNLIKIDYNMSAYSNTPLKLIIFKTVLGKIRNDYT